MTLIKTLKTSEISDGTIDLKTCFQHYRLGAQRPGRQTALPSAPSPVGLLGARMVPAWASHRPCRSPTPWLAALSWSLSLESRKPSRKMEQAGRERDALTWLKPQQHLEASERSSSLGMAFTLQREPRPLSCHQLSVVPHEGLGCFILYVSVATLASWGLN